MVFVIYIMNAVLAGLIIQFELRSDSDKTLFISGTLYFGLIVADLFFALMARFDKEARKRDIHYHFFFCSCLLVAVAFFLQITLGQ
jgi:hypothetical protein